MLKRSFFGWGRPRISYQQPATGVPQPTALPRPPRITIYIPQFLEHIGDAALKPGTEVQAGQKLSLTNEAKAVAIAPASGTVVDVEPFLGMGGRRLTAVTMDLAEEDEWAAAACEGWDAPQLDDQGDFLAALPGGWPEALLSEPEVPIHTIVVSAADEDLLVNTRRYTLENEKENIPTGISQLKAMTQVDKVVIVAGRDTVQGYGHLGATMEAAGADYPDALPKRIIQDLFNQDVPAGSSVESQGFAFISIETVAALGRTIREGALAQAKTVTIIDKAGQRAMAQVLLGTPVNALLKAHHISLEEGDRLIAGGPMMGQPLFAVTQPVTVDMDAIMVQGGADVSLASDYPCINCGDCVQVCPAKIQVNMLVRFLEARQYETAEDEYDLQSCIDCGLCSYVCVSKIPIFQYITLGKYELERAKELEAENA